MKRIGNIIDSIADFDNLCLAFYKASRGKQHKPDVIAYRRCLMPNLRLLRDNILSYKNIPVDKASFIGKYHYFKIYDPKERTICAASFDERVLHHAIMNVCHDYFESFLIADTFATRPNKGIYKAIDKVRQAMKYYKYAAKLDVRKYFDSISHDKLKELLATKFKDKAVLNLFGDIIDSYHTTPGHGLPIGNLTSQYFANFYLSGIDHFVKRQLKVKIYVRYMDDMLFLSSDKKEIQQMLKLINEQIRGLSLQLKPAVVRRTALGMPFLGYKIYPQKLLLNRTNKIRLRRNASRLEQLLQNKYISQKEYQRHIEPMLSFSQHAYTLRLRKEIFGGSNRVNRGGSWNNDAVNSRVAYRNNNSPSNRNNNLGFRLALAHDLVGDNL